jgi:outer membrane protein TolC
MTVARVQRANLQLSLSNLDLARVRETIGASGRSDVHRWESEVATNRRNVLDADAGVEVARIELNRLLNRPLEEPFAAEDVAVDDPDLVTGEPRLFDYFGNPRTFAAFRDFMVGEGWNASPELRRLDASIAARKRAQTAARRAFWLPDVDLQGGVSYLFDKDGAGSGDPPPPLSPQPSLNWSVELGLSLPLFTGFARHAALRETTLDLERLAFERESLAAGISQRVRSALHVGGASFAGIEQARAAATAARSNLEIVTESYGSGVASVITLIDAQNALLVAEQSAASANYDFLADLMQVERAVGRFHFLQDAPERGAFFERLDDHYRRAGLSPRP